MWNADDIEYFAKFEERIYLFTKDNRVFSFGNQSSAQNLLGLDYSSGQNVSQPREIFELEHQKIVKLVSGKGHMLALSADGAVWAWGSNHWGQLGVGGLDGEAVPVRVFIADHVVDIAASEYTSFALTKCGRALTWGWNRYGQCGVPGSKCYSEKKTTPTAVDFDEEVVSLHTTYYGTGVALTAKAQIYVWGYDSYNSYPDLPKFSGKPVSVATTKSSYYILTEDGSIWKSGWDNQLTGTIFIDGTIKFKAIYADQIYDNILVSESIDGWLWSWHINPFFLIPSFIPSITTLFSRYRPDGHLPFMVKLSDDHTTTTPTTTTTPPLFSLNRF